MGSFIDSVAIQSGMAYLSVTGFVCLVIAAEMLWPREAPMPAHQRVRVLWFTAIAIPIGVAAGSLVSGGVMSLLQTGPLVPRLGFADALLALMTADFFYYWYHRAQHSIPWLWRIHAVHHSAEKLGAGGGFHHLLEAPLKALCVSVPAHIVFGAGMGQIAFWAITLQGVYVHSTTRLHLGPLAYFLSDNRNHRIHHSREPAHFNRNFGFPTMLWDHLFGTAHMPASNEWNAIGLSGTPEPTNVRQWLAIPGRYISSTATTPCVNEPEVALKNDVVTPA